MKCAMAVLSLKTKVLLSIALAIGPGASLAAGALDFAPPACDFAISFPIAPAVESLPNVAPGHVVTKAQTPGDYLPWLVAQCTESAAGSDSITADVRESKDRAMLQRMHAQNIVSSSKHDPRGEWTTTVGDVVIDGKAMVFTKLYIVGPHSALFVTALEPAKGDESTKRRFFASIARRPARSD